MPLFASDSAFLAGRDVWSGSIRSCVSATGRLRLLVFCLEPRGLGQVFARQIVGIGRLGVHPQVFLHGASETHLGSTLHLTAWPPVLATAAEPDARMICGVDATMELLE